MVVVVLTKMDMLSDPRGPPNSRTLELQTVVVLTKMDMLSDIKKISFMKNKWS